MVNFNIKKIAGLPSVSEQLAEARRAKKVSLKQAAAATKISIGYLEALEAGNYHRLPGEIYAKNFLKAYARYLNLDTEKILSLYINEQKVYSKTRKIDNSIDVKKPVKRVLWHNLIVTPKIVRNLIIASLVIVCLIYLGLKIKAIVSPPYLEIFQPADNLVIGQKVIEVIGRVEPEAILSINGQQVLTDGDGNFSEVLVLRKGDNIIEISAAKKRSEITKVYRKVIVIEEE